MSKKRMTKRVLTMLLCGLITTSTVSCEFTNILQTKLDANTTQAEQPNEEKAVGIFSSYDSILSTYETMVERRYDEKEWLMSEYRFASADEKLLFGALFDMVSQETYTKTCKRSFGYVVRDFNGDGVNELILLRGNGQLIALFTMQDGTPVLLEYPQQGEIAWIDGQGRYCEEYYRTIPNDGAYWSMGIYRIGTGGNLELDIEIGARGDSLSNICYSYQNGEYQTMNRKEYEKKRKELWYKEDLWYNETRKNIGADIVLLGEYKNVELIETHDFYRIYKNLKSEILHFDILDKNGMVWYSGTLYGEWSVRKISAGDCVDIYCTTASGLEEHLIFKGNYEVDHLKTVVARTGRYIAYLTAFEKGGYDHVAIMELGYPPANRVWLYELPDPATDVIPIVSAKFIEGNRLEVVYLSGDEREEKTAIFEYPIIYPEGKG